LPVVIEQPRGLCGPSQMLLPLMWSEAATPREPESQHLPVESDDVHTEGEQLILGAMTWAVSEARRDDREGRTVDEDEQSGRCMPLVGVEDVLPLDLQCDADHVVQADPAGRSMLDLRSTRSGFECVC